MDKNLAARWRPGRRAGWLVAAALGAAVTAFAGSGTPASYATPGEPNPGPPRLERSVVHEETALDMDSYKSATVSCPGKSVVLSGGYQLINLGTLTGTGVRPFVTYNGPAQESVDGTDPTAGWTVTIEDLGATSLKSDKSWALRVIAVCASVRK
jgi:hypothetical protein